MGFEHHVVNGLPPRVVSADTMLATIEELGIVPFFENPIQGYSIEEMTAVENWFDTQEDLSFTPWDWKIPCVQSGRIAYGKFLLGGKAAFATLEWYRELMNYRRAQPKYVPNEAQRQILAYLNKYGSISIKEVRGLLGIKKGAADSLISSLMMQCRVVTGDIIRVYRGQDLHYNGWQVSSFCTPEALFGLSDEKGPATDSFALLSEHIQGLFPSATPAQIARLLA